VRCGGRGAVALVSVIVVCAGSSQVAGLPKEFHGGDEGVLPAR
jgi:hypothetical protein